MKLRQNKVPLGILAILIFFILLMLKISGTSFFSGLSWWWLTAPLWVPFGLVILLFFIWFVAILAAEYMKNK